MKRHTWRGRAFAGALLVTALVAAPATAQIVNGSFETQDYTGWTLSELPPPFVCNGTWGIAANGQAIAFGQSTFDFNDGLNCSQFSPGLPKIYVATDGNYLAYQLQNAAQQHRMSQDVNVGSCQTLTWDMDYQNHWVGGFDPNNQFLAVHIRSPLDDSILQTLFKTTQGLDPQSIPLTAFTADISPFVGSTVRLDVEMQVNRFFFDASFDNFQLTDCIIEADIDIKFCSNPNGYNCKSGGVTPVTIFGTADLDVSDIDIGSLRLCLADLSQCTASGPKSWSFLDRGDPTSDLGAAQCAIDPSTGEELDWLNQDGFDDLDAAFRTQEVVELIGCDGLNKGDASPTLVLIGQTTSGTPIASVPIGDIGIDQLLIQKN